MTWDTSCPDWAQRLGDRKSIIPPPIYPAEADYALSVFKQLRIPDLPGKPTFGEASEPWMLDFVASVFGAYDVVERRQLIREYLLLIAKKNGKSTLCAGVMLTALIIGERDEEEHLILAPTREVADNAFRPAAGMVRCEPDLMALLHIQDYTRIITHRVRNSSLKVVAADTDTVSGKKAGRIMVDELWVFGSRGNAEAMLMEATGGQASRDDGWTIWLSSQSDKPPAGVFKAKLDYFRDVRDGKIHDPKSLPIIYEYPREMIDAQAYLLPENYGITNPNLDKSVSADWLSDQIKRYKGRNDGSWQQFIAKHLNIEIGLSLSNDRWPGADFWESSAVPLTLDGLIEASEVLTVGIDGGGLDDLLGLYVIGRREDGMWMGWGRAWGHAIVLDRRKEIAPLLQELDDVVIVDKVGDDVDEVARIVKRCDESGKLFGVGCDPAGIGAILDRIEANGVKPDKLHGVSQGWRLGGAIMTLERRLAEGGFVHADQKLMDWCAGNAKVEQRANSILITKQASGKAKIDPVIAMFNATHLMATNPAAMNRRLIMGVLGGR